MLVFGTFVMLDAFSRDLRYNYCKIIKTIRVICLSIKILINYFETLVEWKRILQYKY